MRVHVADTTVDVADGATVLDAVRACGIDLPTLCQDDRLAPLGSCRVCLVGLAGWVVAACTTPAADGMVVDPDVPGAREAARGALELIVSELPARALEIPRTDCR